MLAQDSLRIFNNFSEGFWEARNIFHLNYSSTLIPALLLNTKSLNATQMLKNETRIRCKNPIFFTFCKLPTGNEKVSALNGHLELEENCASGVKKAGERHHYHPAPFKTSGEGTQSSHL